MTPNYLALLFEFQISCLVGKMEDRMKFWISVIPALLGFFCSTCRANAEEHINYSLRQSDPVIDACSSYTVLKSENRSASFHNPDVQLCDNHLTPGWYRFSKEAGGHGRMSNECVPNYYCGTFAPGWLEGDHPTVAEGEVKRRVCFNVNGDCCKNAVLIRVKNCGLFYVYRLDAPSFCPFRYCGEKLKGNISSEVNGELNINISSAVKEHKHDLCFNYTLLLKEGRSISARVKTTNICDDKMTKGWFRFSNAAGGRLHDECPPMNGSERFQCGTEAPGWMTGVHPSVDDGVVRRRVCFSLGNDCCNMTEWIHVKNCGDFYIYKLNGTAFCPKRYCGANVTTLPILEGPRDPEPCRKYSLLDTHDRAMNYYNPYVSKTDVTLVPGWYRFHGAAGKRIPEKPVPMFHCGTHAPGWMNGTLPAKEEGAVERQVCFRWRAHNCQFQTKIWVQRCHKFVVYYLPALDINYTRFCGNGNKPDRYYQPQPGYKVTREMLGEL